MLMIDAVRVASMMSNEELTGLDGVAGCLTGCLGSSRCEQKAGCKAGHLQHAGTGGGSLLDAAVQLSGDQPIFGAADPRADLPATLAIGRPFSAALNGVSTLERGAPLRRLVDDSLWNFPPHRYPFRTSPFCCPTPVPLL